MAWLENVEQVLTQHSSEKANEDGNECGDESDDSDDECLTLEELITLQGRGELLVTPSTDLFHAPPSVSESADTTVLEHALSKGSSRLLQVIGEAQLLETAIKNVMAAP